MYIYIHTFQVFNCYATFAISLGHYPLYDIADYWLSATFHNPQLITLVICMNLHVEAHVSLFDVCFLANT